MLNALISVCWLFPLIVPFQVGRWCVRHRRVPAALAIWLLCALALASLVSGVLVQWR